MNSPTSDVEKRPEDASNGSEARADLDEEWTEQEEKQALRQLDLSLMSLLFVLYMLSYIDRSNLGSAYVAGMGKSWGITSRQYSWIIIVYYITYPLGHVFIPLWKLLNLPLWVTFMAIGWGAMSMLQAATTNFGGMIVCRSLLGLFEAGFSPAVPLYLSFFYNKREIGLRYGLYLSAAPLANSFATALAYGIVQARTALEGWQLLFIIEGLPTIIVALFTYFYLPNSPSECRFLTPRQNYIINARSVKARGDTAKGKLNTHAALAALRDPKCYCWAVLFFCCDIAFGSLPAYLPTMVKDMGYTAVNAQGLSAPPYLVAFFVCVGACFLSDRAGRRGVFLAASFCVSGTGFVVLATVEAVAVRYFAIFLVCAGVFPGIALNCVWLTDNQGGFTKRGFGLAFGGMVGHTGSIVGGFIFPAEQGPRYVKGMWICAGTMFAGVCMALGLSLGLWLVNRRRDRVYGERRTGDESLPAEVETVGDAHPMYRYVL
ncbi:MFS transporter [Lasiodiplodia theobromae]|uniref:MFS transporter n=1 Tax=Lasiodiplodia theobromae TaxID=45133 RepID=UPI0015C36EAE|nr:MFS transporter [Lasiodiplodia theobromae]KAF4544573.1 MFS transporter [Lasiodiplodia theobromae]